jgi:ribose 5-phosphate isomerase B
MALKPIVIGCDNAAVELKNIVLGVLKEEGRTFENVGVDSADDQTEYPVIAQRVADKIIASNYEKEGILICGTGIGMAITANKFPGIYAAVCHDNYSAERARLSNNSNVCCMGARIIGPELAKKILREWLSLEFKGGRSLSKVEKISAIEKANYAVAAKGGPAK